MLSAQVAASGYKSFGAEAPPTTASTASADGSSIPRLISQASVGGTSVPTLCAQVATTPPETTTSKPRRACRHAENRAIATPHPEVPPSRALQPILNSRAFSIPISRFGHRFHPQQIFVVCVTRCTDAMWNRRICVLLCATRVIHSRAVATSTNSDATRNDTPAGHCGVTPQSLRRSASKACIRSRKPPYTQACRTRTL
ncbi:DUF6053 domain-containing protein [Lysobacter enzymogenes]|uniref:DUF6053 domain-containing protein n=1 Tax=Lysobacter enzymogenes TaxID=69 RepID=UPI003D18A35D